MSDDEDDLICQSCKKYFDEDKYKPKMLPICGHTYCETCILNFMEQSKNNQTPFICPEDKVNYEEKTNIYQFPTNIALQKMIQRKKKSCKSLNSYNLEDESNILSHHSKETSQSEISSPLRNKQSHQFFNENESQSKCLDHQKVTDIVCIDCKIMICPNCALFGSHKNHKIIQEATAFEEITNRAEKLLELLESINQKEEQVNDKEILKQINKKLMESKKLMTEQISYNFKELKLSLEKKEKQVKNELDQKIQELIEKSQNQILNRREKILGPVSPWKKLAQQKIQNLCDLTEQHELDFELMNIGQLENEKDILIQGKNIEKQLEMGVQNELDNLQDEEEYENLFFQFSPYQGFIDNCCQFYSKKDNEISVIMQNYSQRKKSMGPENFRKFVRKSKQFQETKKSVENFKGIFEKKKNQSVILNQSALNKIEDNLVYDENLELSIMKNDQLLLQDKSGFNFSLLQSKNDLGEEDNININNNNKQFQMGHSIRLQQKNVSFQAVEEGGIDSQQLYGEDKRKPKKTDTLILQGTNILDDINEDEEIQNEGLKSPQSPQESKVMNLKRSLISQINQFQIEEKFKNILKGLLNDEIHETCDMTCANIGDEGIHLVVSVLEFTNKLKNLKLVRNKITDKGVQMFLDGISEEKYKKLELQNVNFSSNRISEKILENIAERQEIKLKHISLNQNFINPSKVKGKIQEIKEKLNVDILL